MDSIRGGAAELRGDEARHLTRVLRVEPGQRFEISDNQPTPFDRYASGEDRERISEALLQVDTLYREVLVLRFHEELSLQEIATVTRAPLSTVKSRLYRGMAAIKPKLENSGERSPEGA